MKLSPRDRTRHQAQMEAVRYCRFSTRDFVEPITVWDENRLFAFEIVHRIRTRVLQHVKQQAEGR